MPAYTPGGLEATTDRSADVGAGHGAAVVVDAPARGGERAGPSPVPRRPGHANPRALRDGVSNQPARSPCVTATVCVEKADGRTMS